ncbi:hypothetical protein ACIRON_19595 [Nocardioides sp. NPDC101246]|uniref:hypothetical protein n=1 Tax=Nocardioides sp. NPDC101246 TaxID=3364336 RepID=UPI00382B03F3
MTSRLLAAPAAAAATLALLALPVSPASAAARVTIAGTSGQAVADSARATTVTVSGNGFQSIKNGHGGVYVFFGTVKGTWQPSRGGQTGRDYFYVPDSEAKDNAGYQRYVAFPGSDTGSAANGGRMSADGSWSTSLVIPGASFQAVDRAGRATTIDCLKVTCGVITVGAHGVTNANNETFTPVSFRSSGAAPATPQASATPTAPTSPRASAAPAPSAAPAAPFATGKPKAEVDRSTAVVGRVLSFTGAGFTPGEQVTATFDDGVAAVGPLQAGAGGEVAGVLQLPADTVAGTHTLRLSGAASGAQPEVSFGVASPVAAATSEPWLEQNLPAYAFAGGGLLVLISAVIFSIVVSRRRRAAA